MVEAFIPSARLFSPDAAALAPIANAPLADALDALPIEILSSVDSAPVAPIELLLPAWLPRAILKLPPRSRPASLPIATFSSLSSARSLPALAPIATLRPPPNTPEPASSPI